MSNGQIARDLVRNVLHNLPHNTNRVYAELELKQSNCKLYLPLRNAQLDNAKKVKDFYQDLFDKAEY